MANINTVTIDGITYDLAGNKSTVSFSQTLTSGTEIGEITIDGTPTSLYAPSGGGSQSTWFASSMANAAASEKTVACSGFTLEKGSVITVMFLLGNTNTGEITMNVNSTGAKVIYYRGLATGSNYPLVWSSTTAITFVYDGTHWIVISIGKPLTSTVTIAPSDWSSNTATVTLNGVRLDSDITVTYAPTSRDDYVSSGIYCSSSGANSLTFTCDTEPTNSVTVNVMLA